MPTINCPNCRQTVTIARDVGHSCPQCGAVLHGKPVINCFVRGDADLRQVAKYQRRLLWYVLALIAAQLAPLLLVSAPRVPVTELWWLLHRGTALAMPILFIVVAAGMVQLAAAMRWPAVLCLVVALLMIAPCINIVILLIINSGATSRLRAAGLRVGLMGVKDADVVRLLSPHLCHTCGYDLTGNVSGICPECGTPAQPAPARPLTS